MLENGNRETMSDSVSVSALCTPAVEEVECLARGCRRMKKSHSNACVG